MTNTTDFFKDKGTLGRAMRLEVTYGNLREDTEKPRAVWSNGNVRFVYSKKTSIFNTLCDLWDVVEQESSVV